MNRNNVSGVVKNVALSTAVICSLPFYSTYFYLEKNLATRKRKKLKKAGSIMEEICISTLVVCALPFYSIDYFLIKRLSSSGGEGFSKIRNELPVLLKKLSLLKNRCLEALSGQDNDLKEEHMHKKGLLAGLVKNITEKEGFLKSLNDKLLELEKSRLEKDQETQSQQKIIVGQKQAIEELGNEVEALFSKKEELSLLIQQEERNRKKMLGEIEGIDATIQQKRETLRELEGNIAQLEILHNKKKDEKEQLLKGITEEAEKLRSENTRQINLQLNETQIEIESQQQVLLRITGEVDELSDKVEVLTKKKDALTVELQTEETLREKLYAERKELDDVDAAIQKKHEKLRKQEETLATLEDLAVLKREEHETALKVERERLLQEVNEEAEALRTEKTWQIDLQLKEKQKEIELEQVILIGLQGNIEALNERKAELDKVLLAEEALREKLVTEKKELEGIDATIQQKRELLRKCEGEVREMESLLEKNKENDEIFLKEERERMLQKLSEESESLRSEKQHRIDTQLLKYKKERMEEFDNRLNSQRENILKNLEETRRKEEQRIQGQALRLFEAQKEKIVEYFNTLKDKEHVEVETRLKEFLDDKQNELQTLFKE